MIAVITVDIIICIIIKATQSAQYQEQSNDLSSANSPENHIPGRN